LFTNSKGRKERLKLKIKFYLVSLSIIKQKQPPFFLISLQLSKKKLQSQQTLYTNMRKLDILFVLTLGLGITVFLLLNWGFTLTKEKNQFYQENQVLSQQISALDELKNDLKEEVDTLMNTYGQVTKEKECLERLLRKSKRELAVTHNEFQQFRMESATAIQSLKESIHRLVKAKSTLETTIQATEKANNTLLDQAGIDRAVFKKIMYASNDQTKAFKALQREFAMVQEKREEAARAKVVRAIKVKSNQRPKKINRKILRATSFRTETEMRNGKITAKAKRVKRVVVSFDLQEIPKEQLGEQELYLVIKDAKKRLLNKDAPTVKVRIRGLLQEVRVVKTKKVILEKEQRIIFRFDVPQRLEAGYHKVEVYAKGGLLGKTSFRVE